MKKLVSLLTCAAALASFGTAGAQGGRTENGEILLRTIRITQLPDQAVPVLGNPNGSNGVYFRQARCAYVIGQTAGDAGLLNGVFGYVVALTEDEADGAHTFTATSSAGNISVSYYEDLGTCENQPASVTSFEGLYDTPGAEEGQIPEFATHAILVVEDADQVTVQFTSHE